jgi:hypothetical protein
MDYDPVRAIGWHLETRLIIGDWMAGGSSARVRANLVVLGSIRTFVSASRL